MCAELTVVLRVAVFSIFVFSALTVDATTVCLAVITAETARAPLGTLLIEANTKKT